MNLKQHAEHELKLAGYYNEDGLYAGMIPEAVLELIDVFIKQGHSGSSAPIIIHLFKKLALYKPLSPITGEDDEWVCDHFEKDSCQNKRLSSVFKKRGEQAYYLDAITWQGEDEYDTFHGTVDGITSRQYVKFPFIPKTFTVHVKKEYYDGIPNDTKEYFEECYTDGTKKYYKYVIKDKSELSPVFDYYDEKQIR